MKIFTSRNLTICAFALFLTATLNGCKKEEETNPTAAFLRVVNASPSAPTYNVYFNGSILTTAALPYAGGVAYGSYAAGSYNIKFTSANSTESLLTKTVTLSPSTYNSYYLINRSGALDGLSISDDLTATSADKAYIRFINLSPDAPALDLVKTGETSSLTSNKPYKAVSGFIAVDAGANTFDAKETSTGTIKASLASTLIAGYHYDIICGGLVSPADDSERAINLQAITIK